MIFMVGTYVWLSNSEIFCSSLLKHRSNNSTVKRIICYNQEKGTVIVKNSFSPI